MPGVIIKPLASAQEMEQAEDLQRSVWPGSETDIVPAHLLLTVASNGGLVLGAMEGDPTGKVLKRELRKRYWQGHDRGVN